MTDLFRPTVLPIDPFGTPDTGFKTFRVTSPYGERDDPLNPGHPVFHGGLDLGNARLGDKIVACANGIVVFSTNKPAIPWSYPSPPAMVPVWGPSYGGQIIVVQHRGGIYTQYAHLGSRLVASGDAVRRGQLIATVGESGAAKGRGHLHFGVRDRARLHNGHNGFVDPWPLIDATGPWEDPAVIAELREDLARCRVRVSGLLERRDTLLATIAELEAQIEALEEIAGQVPDLEARVKRLRATVLRLHRELEAERDDEVTP